MCLIGKKHKGRKGGREGGRNRERRGGPVLSYHDDCEDNNLAFSVYLYFDVSSRRKARRVGRRKRRRGRRRRRRKGIQRA